MKLDDQTESKHPSPQKPSQQEPKIAETGGWGLQGLIDLESVSPQTTKQEEPKASSIPNRISTNVPPPPTKPLLKIDIHSPVVDSPLISAFPSDPKTTRLRITEGLLAITSRKANHEEAQRQYERWKRVTTCKEYGVLKLQSTAARRLNSLRADYKSLVLSLGGKVEKNENRLSRLPDPSVSILNRFNPHELRTSIANYKSQLLVFNQTIQRIRERHISLLEMEKARTNSTLRRIEDFQQRLETIRFNLDDIRAELEPMIADPEAMNLQFPAMKELEQLGQKRVREAREHTDQMNARFSVVDTSFGEHDANLQQVLQQKQDNERRKAELQRSLEEAEATQQARRLKIKELSQAVQTLHEYNPDPTPVVPSEHHLQALATKLVQDNLTPLLEGLRKEFNNQLNTREQTVKNKLEERIGPILRSTQAVLDQAKPPLAVS